MCYWHRRPPKYKRHKLKGNGGPRLRPPRLMRSRTGISAAVSGIGAQICQTGLKDPSEHPKFEGKSGTRGGNTIQFGLKT